jgi:hypothetical protein
MAHMTAWENGVKQRIEGEDLLSEEFVFDGREDQAFAKRHKSLVVKLAQKNAAIEKEGEKQAKGREDEGREEDSKEQNTRS